MSNGETVCTIEGCDDQETVRHHTSYEEDKTVPVCRSHHEDIHNDPDHPLYPVDERPPDPWVSVSVREPLWDELEAYALDKRSRPGTEANRIIQEYLNGSLADPEDAVRAGEADAAAIDRVQALMETVMNPIEASNAMDRVREEVES